MTGEETQVGIGRGPGTLDAAAAIPGRVAGPGPLLTAAEHEFLKLTVDLTHRLARIIKYGPGRRADLNEGIAHIHVLQRMVLAQAAARAYPDLYRPLGGDPPDGGAGPPVAEAAPL